MCLTYAEHMLNMFNKTHVLHVYFTYVFNIYIKHVLNI